MDIYDSRYFVINKKFLIYFGLWPSQNYKQKLFMRGLIFSALALIILPQGLRVYLNLQKDLDAVLEHSGMIMFFSSIMLKLLTSIIHEKKLEKLYVYIGKNFQTISEKEERKVLIDYSEKGRLVTILYIGYIICTMIAFIILAAAPLVLNKISPSNVTFQRTFLLGGDYFVDRDEYYTHIFLLDIVCILICAPLMCAFDSMYFVSVQHCLGLFAIVKFRLRQSTKWRTDETLLREEQERIIHGYIVKTIELHKSVLLLSCFVCITIASGSSFTEILEATYTSIFFIFMGLNMLFVSFACVLVLVNIGKAMLFVRFSSILVGAILHLFFISWPGQALIDYSAGLGEDAYTNEWYDISIDSQRLLQLVTVRCIKPCQLTAGKIYVMRFANFAMIIKTSVSFMTMVRSFR